MRWPRAGWCTWPSAPGRQAAVPPARRAPSGCGARLLPKELPTCRATQSAKMMRLLRHIGTAMKLTHVVPTVILGRHAANAIPRSSRAATLPYEPSQATTRPPCCLGAMPCYARVCGGRCGGDPSMACKGSGVQIPSAPPQVRGPLRRRPVRISTFAPHRRNNRPCAANALIQSGGHRGRHRRGRLGLAASGVLNPGSR